MNSFDPVLYQLGMTKDLLRILDDLTYADAALLRRFGSKTPPLYDSIQAGTSRTVGLEAVNKLIRLDLVDDAWKRDPKHRTKTYSITDRARSVAA